MVLEANLSINDGLAACILDFSATSSKSAESLRGMRHPIFFSLIIAFSQFSPVIER